MIWYVDAYDLMYDLTRWSGVPMRDLGCCSTLGTESHSQGSGATGVVRCLRFGSLLRSGDGTLSNCIPIFS